MRGAHESSQIAQWLKGATSRRLREEFPHRQRIKSLWTPSVYVGTAGHVSAEVIQRSIEECQGK